jgi:class 3 adenylate cyclase
MMFLDDLGTRIRSRREKRGLTQQAIAHALQVSPQAVSKWERGENAPDITVLPDLARLLGVTVDWLLGRAEGDLDVFEATAFASSVSGAFEKSLRMDPRDFAEWANGVFHQLTEAVLRHEAVPIKYMGDQFLCFFSGPHHARRSLAAARLAQGMVNENLKIGLATGAVYLGSVGHADYARADIMGETVNAAFLTMNWAETHTETGIAATASLVEAVGLDQAVGKERKVTFRGHRQPLRVLEMGGEEG